MFVINDKKKFRSDQSMLFDDALIFYLSYILECLNYDHAVPLMQKWYKSYDV